MAITIAIPIKASADNPSLVGSGVGEGVVVVDGVGEGDAVGEGVAVGVGIGVGVGVGVDDTGGLVQVTLTVLAVKVTSSPVTTSYKDETPYVRCTAALSVSWKLATAFSLNNDPPLVTLAK